MKIAIINFTFGKKTGIEILADNIMQQIDRIDKENQYILIVNEFVQGFYKDTPGISKKVVKTMARSQILKTIWLLVIYPIYSLIKGIDITIIFSGTSNFSLSLFTKNIIYIHDLGELYINNKYDRKRMIYRKYLTLPINKIFGDVFIAVSKSTQQAIIEKLKVDKRKVKLIYNGTGESIYKLDRGDTRKQIAGKYMIRESDKIIITVGRIDPVGKNLIKIIEAADLYSKTYKDFHLFLIGDSNFPNSYLVPEEIENRNLKSCITLTGYIDVNELNVFYNASDLLVFPSIYEGFGLPLLEAMKCDLPVACSDIDIFHEVASDAALFFDPYNSRDIAEKMAILLHDQSIRNIMIKKGKNRQSAFSWERSAKELMKLLQE